MMNAYSYYVFYIRGRMPTKSTHSTFDVECLIRVHILHFMKNAYSEYAFYIWYFSYIEYKIKHDRLDVKRTFYYRCLINSGIHCGVCKMTLHDGQSRDTTSLLASWHQWRRYSYRISMGDEDTLYKHDHIRNTSSTSSQPWSTINHRLICQPCSTISNHSSFVYGIQHTKY
jgi:hypothetical protein